MRKDILLLKIHKALAEGKDLYDAIRGNWVVSQSRFEDIKYVVGVKNREIICAYQPTSWGRINEGADQGRKYFEGVDAPNEVFAQLKRYEEELLKKFGSGNPVAYASLSELH